MIKYGQVQVTQLINSVHSSEFINVNAQSNAFHHHHHHLAAYQRSHVMQQNLNISH